MPNSPVSRILKRIVRRVIDREGGWTLHKVSDDPGGLTYAGISQEANPDWEGWSLLPELPDGQDVLKHKPSSILRNSVVNLYRKCYWDRLNCDFIAGNMDEECAEAVFDAGVNLGVVIAAKMTQLAVGAKPDGILGPRSMELLQEFDVGRFCERMAIIRITRYHQISGRKTPSKRKFFFGWVGRALNVLVDEDG